MITIKIADEINNINKNELLPGIVIIFIAFSKIVEIYYFYLAYN